MIPQILLAILAATSVSAFTAQAQAAKTDERLARVYKTVGKRELKLFIQNPPDWKASDKRPALIFFHGGGWKGGAAAQFTPQGRYFSRRGLVCIQVQYRTLGGKPDTPLVCIQDAKSALRWVRSHAAELGVDAQRIAAGGGSAGGHLAAFTGMVEGLDDPADDLTISPKPQALLLFNPVFDNGPGGFGYERVQERYREFSPIDNISADDPPSIVFLGTADNLIPVATAQRFQTESRAAGVRSELHLYQDAIHGFFNDAPYLEQTVALCDEFLVSLGWLPRNQDATLAARTLRQKK